MRIALPIVAGIVFGILASVSGAEFHVATNGDDAGPGTKERPFATITRARDAIRDLKKRQQSPGPIEVVIHGGTYFLPQTVILTPEDSGSADAPIVYRAFEGERVVISGGYRIPDPWRREQGEIWSTVVSIPPGASDFRQLFVNGRREIRARYPNADAEPPYLFGKGEKKDSIVLPPGQVRPYWSQSPDVLVHVVPERHFFNQIQRVLKVDPGQSLIYLGPEEQHARIVDGSWFFIDGVREELDQPREWFFDSQSRRLYYWPEVGQDPQQLEIIAPRLNRLFYLKGDVNAGTHVEYVVLHGLEFRHTSYTLGHIEPRTNTDGAVVLENARYCRIKGCHFENLGGYGIWLHLDSCENTIDGNTITDAGGGGVLLTSACFGYMDDTKVYTPGPAAARVAPLRNRITRNHIHHCGLIRYYCSGVHLDSRPAETALQAGNLIAHNHIHDMSRNGIFAFRNQGGNIIEFNRIENIMLSTVDGGGIHIATMNQIAAPNLITNNLIANVWGWQQTPSGRKRHIARGVYLDWFTASTCVTNNVIYNTHTGGLQFNAGDDNQFVNNVVVGDTVQWNTTWRGANAQGTVDERNVVLPGSEGAPLKDPAHGDFTLAQQFAGYPPGFVWVDVNEIGLAGTATSGVPLSAMARKGGVVTWNTPEATTVQGRWQKRTASGMWGLYNFTYLAADPSEKASITFTLPIQQAGLHTVRINFPPGPNCASNVRVEVTHAEGTTVETVNMRRFGFWRLLGQYRFTPEIPAQVTISTLGADGQVVIEGVGLMEIKSPCPN